MNPLTVAIVVAGALALAVVGVGLMRDLGDTRTMLTREQRKREDAARATALEEAHRAQELDIVASVFDPLGLFH